jgi:hypothetical protein
MNTRWRTRGFHGIDVMPRGLVQVHTFIITDFLGSACRSEF